MVHHLSSVIECQDNVLVYLVWKEDHVTPVLQIITISQQILAVLSATVILRDLNTFSAIMMGLVSVILVLMETNVNFVFLCILAFLVASKSYFLIFT